jgi:hypothetical protein
MVYERDKQWFEDEFEKWNSEDYCKTAVQEDGYALQYVHKQTPELCKLAVQQNGYALLFVRDEATFKKLLSKV